MKVKDPELFLDYETRYGSGDAWLSEIYAIAEQIEAWIGDGLADRQAFARALRDKPSLLNAGSAESCSMMRCLTSVWELGTDFEGFVKEAQTDPSVITEPIKKQVENGN